MPEDDDPIKFAPGVLESLNTMLADDQDEIRDLLAILRQAHAAWLAGRYASLDDAIEAITGSRPEKLD